MPAPALPTHGPITSLHVVPHIDAEASGPSYAVPSLCRALDQRGDPAILATLGGPSALGIRVRHERFAERGPSRALAWSPAMGRGLKALAREAAVVHNHNLWGFPPIYAANAARSLQKPLIVSPRGTLTPSALSHSRLKKKIMWLLGQRASTLAAACFHATGEEEYAAIRAFGLTAPVAIIPNGIDLPALGAARTTPPVGGQRTALYLGRIHPIKGLANLLTAWSRLAAQHPDWDLRLVGPDEDNHLAALQAQVAAAAIPRVSFAGPAYGPAKQAAYDAASLFILPSFSENFGMSAAEALATGVPVITTTGTPWRGLVDHGAGWWVAPDADGLTGALAQALPLPASALAGMGARGQDWMARDFSWEGIAAAMSAVYRWLAGRGDMPAQVRTE